MFLTCSRITTDHPHRAPAYKEDHCPQGRLRTPGASKMPAQGAGLFSALPASLRLNSSRRAQTTKGRIPVLTSGARRTLLGKSPKALRHLSTHRHHNRPPHLPSREAHLLRRSCLPAPHSPGLVSAPYSGLPGTQLASVLELTMLHCDLHICSPASPEICILCLCFLCPYPSSCHSTDAQIK